METIRTVVAGTLGDDSDVLAVYLFGSRSRGDDHTESDIDLAVLFDERGDLERVVDLEDSLECALGASVDLVDVARADPFLALDVVRGERIFCRDSTRCDEFDLYVLRRAGDLAPFEWERRRMLLGFDPREAPVEDDRR